jgi:hypothetical protein
MLGRFNSFLKSVIMRVSEARDLGEVDRFAFYEHSKAYTAAPPDVLRVDEKHLREHSVLNCTGVIFTSNHKTDGLFLPPDDRRHFVAWSDRVQEDFRNGQKWRTGCEGRISVIKRRHGLSRCRYKGDAGMKRWVGLGVIADNVINIGHAMEKQSHT